MNKNNAEAGIEIKEKPAISHASKLANARYFKSWGAFSVFCVALVTTPLLIRLTAPNVRSDLMVHASLAKSMTEDGGGISYSIWYVIFRLATLGSEDVKVMRIGVIAIAIACIAAKTIIAYIIATKYITSLKVSAFIAISISFVMPIIDPLDVSQLFLGKINPNIYHNATNILVAPFALLAWYFAAKFIKFPSYWNAGICALWILISTLCKPNYSLALLLVLGVAVLLLFVKKKVNFTRALILGLISCTPTALLLYIQSINIFLSETVRESSLEVSLFKTFSAYQTNISLSLFLSLLGPVLIWAACTRQKRSSPEFLISYLTLAVAVIELVLFAEILTKQGRPSYDWFWGANTALMVVFFAGMILLFQKIEQTPSRNVFDRCIHMFVLISISLHLGSGLYYIFSVGKTFPAWHW